MDDNQIMPQQVPNDEPTVPVSEPVTDLNVPAEPVAPVPDSVSNEAVVPEAALPEEPEATVPPQSESQEMPPIVRPEDILTTTDPFTVEAEVPVPEPAAIPETPEISNYAPQPAAVVGEQPEMWENEPVPSAPVVAPVPEQTTPNPAMVPDPLMDKGIGVDSSIPAEPSATEELVSVPMETEATAAPIPKGSRNLKRYLIYGGIGIIAIALIATAGYFGYHYYITSTNTGILQTAGANLANAKQMSTDITVGMDAISLTGKLDVDKDQNLRFTTAAYGVNLSLIYLKVKDSLYFGMPDYSQTGTPSQTVKNYSAYTNIKKAYETISKTYVNLGSLNPKSNFFTTDNMKYITRDPDESVGGTSLYKFTFKPSKEYLAKSISDLRSKSKDLPFDVSNTDLTADVWIDQGSLQITKIEGNVSVNIKSNTSLGVALDSNYKFSWKEDFSYNFKDAIKLPIGAKITSSTDAADMVDGTFGEGAQLKAEDAKLKADIHETQNALEQYFIDNEKYPTQAQGLAVLFTGTVPYLSDRSVISGITYKVVGSGYEISAVLNNQNETLGDNVKTISGKKVYYVTSKQD